MLKKLKKRSFSGFVRVLRGCHIEYTQSQVSALTGYILSDPQTLKDL